VTSIANGATTVPRLAGVGRVTQTRVTRSEWTKFRSLRSTRWSLLVAVVLTIGLPLLIAFITSSRWSHLSPLEQADRYQHRFEFALAGVDVAQLAVAVLGVLLITGEYSTGMIRASLTAVPRRLPVLWAKAAVFAAVVFVLVLPSVVLAFFGSQAIFRHHHILQISFSHPGVPRAILGGAVYLVLVGIFALAIGTIVRSTAGGIATFAAIFFVVPPLLDLLPSSWNNAISPYLPSSAGRAMFALTRDAHSLGPYTGLALFAGYCAVALAVAAFLLVRRDA
jgi:ABC-type transport system involved in multi-copper enzyme maturation permease subunit